jgi:hypothetical protein
MNCKEFSVAYNAWLDTRKLVPLWQGAALHVRACRECSAYADEMGCLDAALRGMAEIPVPVSVLRVAPVSCAVPARSFRNLLPALAGLVAWGITLALPPPWNAGATCVLVTSALVACALASLRPMFIA